MSVKTDGDTHRQQTPLTEREQIRTDVADQCDDAAT